jgi:phosphate/sulfate permease
MAEHVLGAVKWAAVGFVVAFVLMRLYDASHIHEDIPRPPFKQRQSRRAALVLSVFAALLSAAVWLLVQRWD